MSFPPQIFLTILIMVTEQLYWRKVLCGCFRLIWLWLLIANMKRCAEQCELQLYFPVEKFSVFNSSVVMLLLKYTKIPLSCSFLSRRKVKKNHQSRIVRLEKTRQFSFLKSIGHLYLKQLDSLITETCS